MQFHRHHSKNNKIPRSSQVISCDIIPSPSQQKQQNTRIVAGYFLRCNSIATTAKTTKYPDRRRLFPAMQFHRHHSKNNKIPGSSQVISCDAIPSPSQQKQQNTRIVASYFLRCNSIATTAKTTKYPDRRKLFPAMQFHRHHSKNNKILHSYQKQIPIFHTIFRITQHHYRRPYDRKTETRKYTQHNRQR